MLIDGCYSLFTVVIFILIFYLMLFIIFYFFFFKQKTAYEMRISDWSSDVCSSDLRSRSAMRRGWASARSADSSRCRHEPPGASRSLQPLSRLRERGARRAG